MRVVVDTHALVSALLFGGPPEEIHKAWKAGTLRLLVNQDGLSEYIKVLAYPKFGLSEDLVGHLLNHEVLPYIEPVKPGLAHSILKIPTDKADLPFLVCAVQGQAHALISGDKHLLSLRADYPFIFSVKDFLLHAMRG
jgi:putative PIN family toxin of toxin-antitoxin system